MKPAYDVGVILVNYKNADDTVECLRSLQLSVGVETPFAVVVDVTPENNELTDRCAFYPAFSILTLRENQGFGKANNFGIAWALEQLSVRYLFILNNDTIVDPDAIATLIGRFPSDGVTALVAPKILTHEAQPKIWYAGGRFNFGKMSVDVAHIGEEDKEVSNGFTDFASGCAMLFRADFFRRYPAFDPAIFMYDEDLELCLRLAAEGKRIFFVGEAVIYHKCQGSQKLGSGQTQKTNQLHPHNPGVRFYLENTIPNRYYLLRKYFEGRTYYAKKSRVTFYWWMKACQYLLYGNFRLAWFTVGNTLVGKK